MKTWGELASYDGYGGAVTGVKFGKSASFLVRRKQLHPTTALSPRNKTRTAVPTSIKVLAHQQSLARKSFVFAIMAYVRAVFLSPKMMTRGEDFVASRLPRLCLRETRTRKARYCIVKGVVLSTPEAPAFF